MAEPTRYATTDGLHVAFRVLDRPARAGEAKFDVLVVHGLVSNLDVYLDYPRTRYFTDRIGRYARVIMYDRRGVGLSDPTPHAPSLEERVHDMTAVLDAAGSERAVLVGVSEGAPACVLMSAMHPERVDALVLLGGMARGAADDDYPFSTPAADLITSSAELIAPHWGEGATAEMYAPSCADDPDVVDFYGRLERQGASLAMVWMTFEAFLAVDVRDILPSVRVPTLVLHRSHDRVVNVRAGRWLAEQIPDARFVEVPGIDHSFYAGDQEPALEEIEEFLVGTRLGRQPTYAFRTVLFTDIVDSTARAAELGDQAWRELLDRHDACVRKELARFGGREVKTLGDGFLAVFESPSPALHCALAVDDATGELGCLVRAGVHAGECEITGADVTGIAVNVAARVASAADGGEVLVSRTVADLVLGSSFTFESRGEHELKGVPGTWELLAVMRPA